MDGLLPENVKVLIYCIARVEYVRKGRQGDHNIQFQKHCDHQEYQRAPFHAQVVGDNFYPLQYSAWPLISSVQRQICLTYS